MPYKDIYSVFAYNTEYYSVQSRRYLVLAMKMASVADMALNHHLLAHLKYLEFLPLVHGTLIKGLLAGFA